MKFFSTLLALLALFSASGYAQTAIQPGPIKFGTNGTVTPTVGHCLDILAITSSGVTATDAGAACGGGVNFYVYANVPTNGLNINFGKFSPGAGTNFTLFSSMIAPGANLLANQCGTTNVTANPIVGITYGYGYAVVYPASAFAGTETYCWYLP